MSDTERKDSSVFTFPPTQATTNMTAANRGPKFDYFLSSDVDHYEQFKDRVELFFALNPEEEKKKAMIFLNAISMDLYSLIDSLCRPAKPANKTLQEIFKFLDGHYKKTTNKRAERVKFNRLVQKPDESIREFVGRLREAAQTCAFGDVVPHDELNSGKLKALILEEALLDRLVMGVNNKEVQVALLQKELCSLDEAVDVASCMQVAMDEAQVDRHIQYVQENNEEDVFAVRQENRRGHLNSRPQNDQNKRYQQTSQCHRCGRTPGHELYQCPGRNTRCSSCGRVGHFAAWCQVPRIAVILPDRDPVCLSIRINNVKLNTLVDTGACTNVIAPQVLNRVRGNWKLLKSNTNLCVFSGQKLKVNGQVELPVEYEGNVHAVNFQVVDLGGEYQTLLSRPGLDVLIPGWRNYFPPERSIQLVEDKAIEGAKENVNEETVDPFWEKLQKKFPNVFDKDTSQSIYYYKAQIHMKDNFSPIFAKPYSLPYRFEDKVKSELERLVDNGVLVPCHKSAFASPMVVIEKADKVNIRICIDCKRTVNPQITNEIFYPLPDQDSIFARIGNAHWFCVIDLCNAYLQLNLTEDSQEILTLNTPFGLYRYTKLPFGVSAAPSIFQSVIDDILKGVINAKAYLDDILIWGEDKEECERNLEEVIERLSKYNVKVNLDKCVILQNEVKYLGHILKAGTIGVNPDKFKDVITAPRPSNTKEVMSYVGLLNYFRRFAPGLSQLLGPLYELTKKGSSFNWSTECEKAFEESKRIVSSDSCMALYDPRKDTYLLCDASPIGVAAVLMQVNNGQERPVYYASAKLDAAQRKYSQLHREALAIMFGLERFYKFIFGKQITIVTDAQAVKEMFKESNGGSAVASARMQRWGAKLSGFQYRIIHRNSAKLAVPDALSRLPSGNSFHEEDEQEESIAIIKMVTELPTTFESIKEETNRDEILQEIINRCVNGRDKFIKKFSHPEVQKYSRLYKELSLANGVLFYRDRIVVPATLRKQLLIHLHGNHDGMVLMKRAARQKIFWPGIDKDIEDWVNGCSVCQQTSLVPKKPVVSKWPPSLKPFERVHLDFFYFEGRTFLLIIDTYSKYIDVQEMKRTTADHLIRTLRETSKLFGFPQTFVTDNGPPFSSSTFHDFCKAQNVKLVHSPPFHPESNGQAEAGVKVVKRGLLKLRLEFGKRASLGDLVDTFLFNYRNTPRTTTDRTPLEMLLSYSPRRPLDRSLQAYQVYEEFISGQRIYFRSQHDKGITWVPGVVEKRCSKYIYRIIINGQPRLVHASTLRKRISQKEHVNPMNIQGNEKLKEKESPIASRTRSKSKRKRSDDSPPLRRSKRLLRNTVIRY